MAMEDKEERGSVKYCCQMCGKTHYNENRKLEFGDKTFYKLCDSCYSELYDAKWSLLKGSWEPALFWFVVGFFVGGTSVAMLLLW